MEAERLQHPDIGHLLDGGIDVDYLCAATEDDLKSHLRDLKGIISRAQAVEANVIVALNRLRRQDTPKAKHSDETDTIREQTGESQAEANKKTRRAELFERLPAGLQSLGGG